MEDILKNYKGDKRSKEYRQLKQEYAEWKSQQEALSETPYNKSIGLGDVVEKITEATGIKKMVKALWGDDCGCEDRKEKLNKLFRKTEVKILEKHEYDYLKELYKDSRPFTIKREQVAMLVRIHNRTLGSGYRENTTCSKCIRTCYDNLKAMVEEYDRE